MLNPKDGNFRRLDVTVGISYDSDIKKAKAVLTRLVDENPLVIQDKDKVVTVDDLADSAVVIAVKCHVKTEDYWTLRGQLLEDIKLRFDEEGIMIPYPQLDVHIDKESEK